MSDATVPARYQGMFVPAVFRGDLPEATADTPVNELYFQAIVKIDETEVPITSGNVLNLAAEGISFELPTGKEIQLGTLEKMVNWFADQMGFTRPDWTQLPDTLRKITGAEATVNTLIVKAKGTNVTFDVKVTLKFDGWKIIGNLELKSFSFELIRKQVEPPAPPPVNG